MSAAHSPLLGALRAAIQADNRKNTKARRDFCGFVAMRRYKPTSSVIVLYRAKEQQLDVPTRWAVVCELHGTICAARTRALAWSAMEHPEFCEQCMQATPPTTNEATPMTAEKLCSACGLPAGADCESAGGARVFCRTCAEPPQPRACASCGARCTGALCFVCQSEQRIDRGGS